jgi:hypothetical protein
LSRFARKVDGNQAAVVAALRAVGATVQSLASVGGGCPDLLVGYRGRTYLLEVKDGAKRPSSRRLRPGQETFRDRWRGATVATVHGPEEALQVVCAEVTVEGVA